jgi:putative transposase
MEQQSARKTYQYKLKPTAEQELALDTTLMLCRQIYNAAIGERRAAWRMRGVSVTYSQQKAELPGIKEAMPEYGEVHSQILQDVLLRVERAFQGVFRRRREGQTPGYPRFHGRYRYNSFTYPQYGNGATLDGGALSLSKIGDVSPSSSIAHCKARPRRSPSGGKQMAGMAVSPALTRQCSHFPSTGQETGIDLGLEAFTPLSDGTRIFHPGWYRQAARAPDRATPRFRAQEGKRPPPQSRDVAGESASDGEAAGLPA